MKILLVSELIPLNMIGGLARHCITLGNHLLKMGHEVQIMGNTNFPYDDNVRFEGSFIGGFRLNWHLYYAIEKNTGIFPFPLYLRLSKQIANAINKVATDYDVIHYHGHYPMVANFIDKSINFVQTRHDHSTFCLNKHLFRFSENAVCTSFSPEDCANCFKPGSGPIRRNINMKWCTEWRDNSSRGISGQKTIFVSGKIMNASLKVLVINKTSNMIVVHNFTDTKAILSKIEKQDVNKAKSSGRDNRIMIASALVPPKGVYAFLKAYQKKGYRFPISVAGRGSELSIMREEFKEYPINFLGWLSHKDTINHMSLHQAFVVTSICEESCPTTLLEAMFLNKPVFALRRGGVPELKEYSLYGSQLNLFDSMEELVEGVANQLAVQSVPDDIDYSNTDFGACVTKKALEIISVYKL